jgi:chromosome partitioning protein
MRSIACLNWKGGSGKTTTALALSVGLAQRSKNRVLLVDNDPQSNSTMIMLGGKTADEPTLTDVLLDRAAVTDAIRQTRIDRLSLLPADHRLADCTALLADMAADYGPQQRLSIALRAISRKYDYCIVDASAQLSMLTINVLQAVSEVVVPIDPGLFAVAGLGRLQETVDRVRHYLQHPKLAIVSLLLTRATKSRVTRELEKQLRTAYKSLVSRAVIPHSEAVEEAHASYLTVMESDPDSDVAKAYAKLVTEVVNHGRKRSGDKSGRRPHAA